MTMLKNAVGVTILPLHCCQDLVDFHEFYIARPQPAEMMSHKVYIAMLDEFDHSARVKKVIDTYMKMNA